jgi:CS1 type fimbrial major subunit
MRILLLLLSLFSVQLYAATAVQKSFTLSMQLPRTSFLVTTPEGDQWLTEPQRLEWDQTRRQFSPVRKQLVVKSSVGAVTARLLNNPELSSGAEHINLKVQLGTTELSLTAQPLLSATEARDETLVPLTISTRPRSDGRPYFPGTYLGLVTLVLETSAP